MNYDLLAEFYEGLSDTQPKYKVLLGQYYPLAFDEMKEKGFQKDPESTQGFVDYIKEVRPLDLNEWVQSGYTCELDDIICKRSFYPKIVLRAYEFEPVDDETLFPNRGLMIGKTAIRFEYSDPDSPVFFTDFSPGPQGGSGLWFRVPIKRMKRVLNASTMMEVIDEMKRFGDDHPWSFERLRQYFSSGIEEALEIAMKVFIGHRDKDWNPSILHALAVGMAGKTNNEKIVGFLHDVLKDSNMDETDLFCAGFSDQVNQAILSLTHEKWRETYEQYIDRIIYSGSKLTINVKKNDLKHMIECENKGRHTKLMKKHQDALAKIESYEKKLTL